MSLFFKLSHNSTTEQEDLFFQTLYEFYPLTSGTYVMHNLIGQTGTEFTHKGTRLHSKVIVRYHAVSLVWLFAGSTIKQTPALLDTQWNVFSVWTGSPTATGYCCSLDISVRAMFALQRSYFKCHGHGFCVICVHSAGVLIGSSSPLTFQGSSPTPPFHPAQTFKSGSHQLHFYSEHQQRMC